MRHLKHPLPLLLVQLLAACSPCGKPAAPRRSSEALHRFLPRIAEAVLVVPNPGQLGAKLKQLERLKLASFVAQLQGFPNAEAYVSGVMEQLGVDLRSRDELVRAGVDPEGGVAIAFVSANRGYSVIALGDQGRFREAIGRLAKNRLGAVVTTTREELGYSVTSFARSPGSGAELAFTVRDGFALVTAADSVLELPGYASLSMPESLADAAWFSSALSRLSASRDIYVHIPASSTLARYCGLSECTLSGELTAEALLLRADLPRAASANALVMLEKKDGPDLLPFLPQDASLVARFSGDPLLLSQLWPRLVGSQTTMAIERSGFDVQGEILSNLKPGSVISVSLAPTALLSAMPELDVRRTNPFRFIRLVAIGALKDSHKGEETMAKLPSVASRLGAKLEVAQRQGRKVYLTSYAQGEGAHLAQVGDKVLVAAPLQQLDDALGQLTREPEDHLGAIADPELRKALSESAVSSVLDFPALAKSIRNLPASAWGIGGFAIKGTTLRWLDAMDDLRAVTASLSARGGAVQAEVDLRFVKR